MKEKKKNKPANTGDVCLISGPGIVHIAQLN